MTAGAITRINRLLRAAGHEFRLVRGRGYHYLHGNGAEKFHTSGIYAIGTAFIANEPERAFAMFRSEVNQILERADLAPLPEERPARARGERK